MQTEATIPPRKYPARRWPSTSPAGAESVVVLGRHHHVLHPGLGGQAGPCPRRAALRLPGPGELLVLLHRDALPVHSPLPAAELRVDAPMHEHPEPGLVPPFHAPLSALPAILSCRHLPRIHPTQGRD